MTYFRFLIGFVVFPIVVLLVWLLYNHRADKSRIDFIWYFPIGYSFLLLAIIAALYSTPWDNYLVATSVWWYDPSLVMGITMGWVPIEEYLFFVLQPILGGLLLLFMLKIKSIRVDNGQSKAGVHKWSLPLALTIWIVALAFLISGKPSATYLGLELAWAMPVIILQLIFGADIIWRHRRMVLVAVFALTIYLSLADAFAIQSGVWMINPMKSLGVLLGGILPVEEFVFFLLTNTMVAFGFVLVWSPESRTRLSGIWQKIKYGQQNPFLRKEL
jgi:lycopene cyclase domain-containing protein